MKKRLVKEQLSEQQDERTTRFFRTLRSFPAIKVSPLIEKDSHYLGLLLLLFCSAFAIPILFIANLGVKDSPFQYGSNSWNTSAWESGVLQGSSPDEIFASAVNIASPPSFLRLKDSGGLIPQAGEDFLFITWFKLRKFPQSGEQIIFVAKVDASDRSRRGYTIGVTREGNSLRPVVTWRGGGGKGVFHLFSEMTLLPRRWGMLAVSFVDDRYLGVHFGRLEEGGQMVMESLGGYEVDPEIWPSSRSDLVLGSQKNGLFRGWLGPIGVFSHPEIGEDLEELAKQFTRKPTELPALLSQQAVRFWSIDGREDLSKSKILMKRIGVDKPSRKETS